MEYFKITQWQYGPLVLFGAFFTSFLTVYAMRNLKHLGINKEIPWIVGRIIVITAVLLGGWVGGCIEASFSKEKEMLSMLMQLL